MNVNYTLNIKSNCPIDFKPDVYECQIFSDKGISVEEILIVTKKYEDLFMFQEALTEDLSRDLCAKVITVGWHSGVRVVVEA